MSDSLIGPEEMAQRELVKGSPGVWQSVGDARVRWEHAEYAPTLAQLACYIPIPPQLLQDVPNLSKWIDERLRAHLNVKHTVYPGILETTVSPRNVDLDGRGRKPLRGLREANQEYDERRKPKRLGFPTDEKGFESLVRSREYANQKLGEALGFPSSFLSSLSVTPRELEQMKLTYCHHPVLPLPKEWNPPQARRRS